MSDQIQVVRRGNPAWTRGVSGNPGGRPKRGQSLADVMRSKCSTEWIAEQAMELAESAESESVRLAALQMIAERTAGKVSDRLELSRGEPDEDEGVDLDALDVETLERLEALEAERERLLSGSPALLVSGETGVGPVDGGAE